MSTPKIIIRISIQNMLDKYVRAFLSWSNVINNLFEEWKDKK